MSSRTEENIFLPLFVVLTQAGRVWSVRQSKADTPRRAETTIWFWSGHVWEICLPKHLCSASHLCSKGRNVPIDI